MGTLQIVHAAPGIKASLNLGQTAEPPQGEDLRLQGAMEALVLPRACG